MSELRAVVFDADGTIFNSKELIYPAYAHVAMEFGCEVPTPQQIDVHMGKPIKEILAALFPDHDVEAMNQFNDEWSRQNAASVVAFDGLKDLLGDLKRDQIKLALNTSSDNRVLYLLEHHGLSDYFSSVVHCERIKNPKPHPESFRLAAKECRVEPGEAAMVGDMPYDIETGQRGGAKMTIGLTHGFGKREALVRAGADYIIDSLYELPPILEKVRPVANI